MAIMAELLDFTKSIVSHNGLSRDFGETKLHTSCGVRGQVVEGASWNI
jgi:hypothetical protein